MTDVQSSNIRQLCSELGFCDVSSSEDLTSFKRSLTHFRVDFESQGNPLPGTNRKSNSREAQTFALAFCLGQNRAEALWPVEEGPRRRPTWAADREKILKKVAHIFALQAFYHHQKYQKKRKHNTATPAETQGGQWDERELSPESLKFVGMSLPSGTRRRPAKPINSEAYTVAQKSPTIKACIKEIENLNPSDDSRPIREFTTQWLAMDVPRWPTSADIRMKYVMHIKNWYPLRLDENTPDPIKMVNPLRKGSSLEECYAPEYQRFEERVRERMVLMSQEMLAKKFIVPNEEGDLQKNPVFRDVWKFRELHWEEKAKHDAELTSASQDVPDIFDVPDDEDCIILDLSLPKSKKASAAWKSPHSKPTRKSPMEKPTQMQSNIYPIFHKSPDASSPALRTYNEFPFEDDHQPTPKKQKMDVPDSPKLPHIRPYSSTTSSLPPESEKLPEILTPDAESTNEQQELAAIIREAQEALSSNIGEEKGPGASLESASEPRTPQPEAPLLTPTSFEDVPSPSNVPSVSPKNAPVECAPQPRDSTSPGPEIKDYPSPRFTKLSEPWSPKSPFKRSTSTPGTASDPNRQRLILVIQNANRRFAGGTNTLSSAHLRDSSVFEFFDLYAEKSKASFDALKCLTFTFLFGENEEMVVHRGDVEQWMKLKDLAITLFRLYKTRKRNVMEFKVTVEIGDKTVAEEEEVEDDWGC